MKYVLSLLDTIVLTLEANPRVEVCRDFLIVERPASFALDNNNFTLS